MRISKELKPAERIIYHPELSTCLHCEGPLVLCNYLAWDKTIQTLDQVLSVASRPGHCADPVCPGHTMRLLSAAGQQMALAGSTYGYDVLTRIGWLRQEWRATYAEIQAELVGSVQISESHVRHLYQQTYLPLLACHERQHWASLEQVAGQHQGLFIALDGLAPAGGEPQLWFIRELLTGLTLRSGWLSQQDQATFAAFLQPLTTLPWPILAVVSDKQRGLMPAVAEVLPDSYHQFCQGHYLKNLAEPLAEADEAFKVALRKAIRQEVGELIRRERPDEVPEAGLLTVTGLLPSPLGGEIQLAPEIAPLSAVTTETAEITDSLLRRARYLLTLKGRSPFRLAGIEMYQCFQDLGGLTDELLAHRHEPRLLTLSQGIQSALTQFAQDYQTLQQGAGWLHDIASLLAPDDKQASGHQVAQQLQTYLDDLLELPELAPPLETFRRHLHKVSHSYWPGLFHCYDLDPIPRTNNGLESHFRDTQRQLLRTTGQKALTRRTLQRIGAWELFPRPPTQAQILSALRQVPRTEFQTERQRLQQHLARFHLHTRSAKRTNAQFDKIRQRWLALPHLSTG